MAVDPAELRRRNLLRRDEMPYSSPTGMPYDHMDPLETLERALAVLDYDAFRKEQAAARAQGRYLGVGISCYAEPTTPAFGVYATEGATIRIEPSGKVNVYLAGGSAGNSLETTAVQLAADALGADIADVHTIQGDTAVTPFGAGTGGSRSGSMIAGAVEATAADLRDKLTKMAAHKLEASEADIELAQSRAAVKGDPEAGVSFAELADIAYFQPYALPPGTSPGLEASARYAATGMGLWACATHVCTCEVDVTTGKVTLLRYVVGEDCGHMINPAIVEGQIAGGVVQGIGGALLEELAYDADGNPVATTFMDYLLPTAAEVPLIEYAHVETAPGPGPGGYKGVGEGGAIGAPPAIVNAVADALAPFGVTITRLPLSPAAIVALIDQRREPGTRGPGAGDAAVKPAAFEYHAPDSAEGAVGLLAELGDGAKVIAGGQSLVPVLAMRLAVFDHLIDIRRIGALRGIEDRGDCVWIGAGTTEAEIGRSELITGRVPLLSRATPLIGHFQIRNRGTIGGSLAHADPAAEYPAVALTLGATIEARSPRGRRSIPAAEFFTGIWTTALEPDELLTGVTFPAASRGAGFAIEEFARRPGDFAVAGAVVTVRLDPGGRVGASGIGLFGLGPTPLRAASAEAAVLGGSASDIDPAEIGRAAVANLVSVPSDLHGTADYRRKVGTAIVARAWETAVKEAASG